MNPSVTLSPLVRRSDSSEDDLKTHLDQRLDAIEQKLDKPEEQEE